MNKIFFLLKIMICIIFVLLLNSCEIGAKHSIYKVSLRYIPIKIDVRNNQINTNVYIMAHIYWPLFSVTDTGGITSHFLDMNKTQALNENFDVFQLCLIKDIRFSNHEKIGVEDLKTSLIQSHRNQEVLNPIKSIVIKNDCVVISLTSSDIGYFRKLTGFSTTILKKGDETNFPLGKGAYKIESASNNKISLTLDNGNKNVFYSKIEFIKFKSIEENIKEGIHDWNHIYGITIPNEIKIKSKIIEYPILKTNAVIINHPNSKIRSQFVKCLDIELLKKYLSVNYTNTIGFLPTGVLGYNVDYKKIIIEKYNGDKKCSRINDEVITFYSYYSEKDYVRATDEYFSRFASLLPIKVKIKHTSIQKTAEAIFSNKNYISIIGFDSSGSIDPISEESSIFFESFIRDKRLITKRIVGLKEAVSKAAKESDRSVKNELYTKAHKILLQSDYVIPMGQTADVRYYPKYIKNIKWVERISGIPQINLMVVDNDN